jgi:ABC-type transporter MlaC component
MKRISLFALGKYRRNLPANETDEFVKLTSRYVANTLADFARKFRATAISVIECRGHKVATRLEFGARPAKRATWRIAGGKVIDVNVQYVWLAQLLRDNFVGILKRAGGDIGVLLSHIGAPPPANSN